MRVRVLFLIAAIITMWSIVAVAQSNSQGVYLTKSVRSALAAEIANSIAATAPRVGFNEKETTALVTGARDGSLKFRDYTGPYPAAGAVFAETSLGDVQFRNAVQLDTIQRIASISSHSAFLEKFATVRLDVMPVPPRDYKVIINGEDCPATERSLYRVPAGDTAVNVTRIGKPACAWSGQIPSGSEHVVVCQF
jgi:hypothetical protein